MIDCFCLTVHCPIGLVELVVCFPFVIWVFLGLSWLINYNLQFACVFFFCFIAFEISFKRSSRLAFIQYVFLLSFSELKLKCFRISLALLQLVHKIYIYIYCIHIYIYIYIHLSVINYSSCTWLLLLLYSLCIYVFKFFFCSYHFIFCYFVFNYKL